MRTDATKEDRPTVQALYAYSFTEHFRNVVKLDYDSLGWGDEELTLLLQAFETGAFKRLESLRLRNNGITTEGMSALAVGSLVTWIIFLIPPSSLACSSLTESALHLPSALFPTSPLSIRRP